MCPSVRTAVVAGAGASLMYLRGQIPCPMSQLKALSADNEAVLEARDISGEKTPLRKRAKVKSAMRLCRTWGAFVEAFQSAAALRVSEVAFSFGPSAFNPREIYVVRFADWGKNIPLSHPAPPSRTLLAVKRKLMRTLLNGTALSGQSMKRTKLTVLVRAPASEDALVACGFVPKWGKALRFRQKLRNRMPKHTFVVSSAAAACAGEHEGKDDDLVWYQYSDAVQGLKETSAVILQ